jgi:hypothetical protein
MDERPAHPPHVPVNALTGTFIFRAPPAKAAFASKALSRWRGLLLILELERPVPARV